MNIGFAGRTALVTGAGHGIGRRIAEDFARLGARVVAADILADEVATLAAVPGIMARQLDVADAGAVAAVAAEAGAVDILVCCAGGVAGQVKQPLEAVTAEQWRILFDINVTGAFHCAQAVAPGMKARRAGRIVTISSGAGIRASLTGIQAYAAAKHALVGLTRQLAHELGPFGVTVNSVAPGFVRSNPATERQWESYGPEGQARLVEAIHLRRTGTPRDISNMVLFLASEHADWVTGQVISVDGGRA
ncbi:MAG: SDR family oxidoreductase [Thalassobaculales bacterium]